MLTIRFTRTGKKKQPQYRLIVSEKHKDPWGDYLELLGNYNPHTKEVNLKEDRIKHWLSVGAQTSNSVHNLLVKQGLIEGDRKKAVRISKKRTAKAEAKKKEAAQKAETAKPVEEKIEEKPAEEAKPEEAVKEAEKPAEEPGLTKEAK